MHATSLAVSTHRFLIFYIEESIPDVVPSLGTLELRKSLSDQLVGELINDDVSLPLFMTS